MEELILKKVRGGLRALKMGTKTIDEARVGYFLEKLAKVNDGLYQDYIMEYNRIKAAMKK
jgi:hypothetical protein